MSNNKLIIEFIEDLYPGEFPIPLHRPLFAGNEEKYVVDAIRSGTISSRGYYLDKLVQLIQNITGVPYVIPVVNGTSALHTALIVSGVQENDEVITQAFAFVATANSISYQKAIPLFLDIDPETMGLSPVALESFLTNHAVNRDGKCFNKETSRQIKACIPVHSFGIPSDIQSIVKICKNWNVMVVEDAAESLGSRLEGNHTGTVGELGIFSFNGNKTITAGGGGVIVTRSMDLANSSRHLVSQAKQNHRYKYIHDMVAYNYQMPNLNAALACGQLENLQSIILQKQVLAEKYIDFLQKLNLKPLHGKVYPHQNHWLNGVLFQNKRERDSFLMEATNAGIQCREPWMLLDETTFYKNCWNDGLRVSRRCHEKLALLPSSIPLGSNQ